MPIGTAHMAHLSLPNSELHVGIDWSESSELLATLRNPVRPAVLLYPGEEALDIGTHPPEGPVTLVVVDGTWSQTKKLVRVNPELAKLPRYTFQTPTPSEYRIRKEPFVTHVSTIEAIMHVLGALEGDVDRFHLLLNPFRAMVDAQVAFEQRVGTPRTRHLKAPKTVRPRVPRLLRDRVNDAVYVIGEANAWPYRCEQRAEAPDELVHWVAHRPSTGETLDFVVGAKYPLAPRTPEHTELDANVLAAGRPLDELIKKWRSFVGDSDTICSWGRYATSLFSASGGDLPASRIDLRQVARVVENGKVGTLEEFATKIEGPPSAALARGRAGRRLAQIIAIARHFVAAA